MRSEILSVATVEFAEKGLHGARLEDMAAAMGVAPKSVYHHFKNKEALYVAVLDRGLRAWGGLDLAPGVSADPEQDLAAYVAAVFDHHHTHVDFVRLLMDQNMERGAHVSALGPENGASALIAALEALIDRGVSAGRWRVGIDVVDLQMSIMALCVFTITNHYTMQSIFAVDLSSPQAIRARRDHVVEMILCSLRQR